MSQDNPDLADYVACFAPYGDQLQGLYFNVGDDSFRDLFLSLCPLLIQESPFNLEMPQPFRWTAQRFLAGEAATLAHLDQAENRNAYLSDLHDYIELRRRAARRQAPVQPG